MKMIKVIVVFVWFTLSCCLEAQTKDLNGQLIANDEVEGLHILNKTAAKYTISNDDGSFVIPAKVSDTLVISGVKYQLEEVIITASIIELGEFNVQLKEKVNELNEVVVGKILTGNLESDLENSEAEPKINFYDLGIPGFTGKPLTQNERKLFDADGGDMVGLVGGTYGGGPSLNLNKFLNTISGRTKKLKAIVELDNRSSCIERLRRDYESYIFEKDTLAENLHNEFFLFCQEDARFLNLCKENNDLELLEFLLAKLEIYQENRTSVIKE